jgi:hypothetical protein
MILLLVGCLRADIAAPSRTVITSGARTHPAQLQWNLPDSEHPNINVRMDLQSPEIDITTEVLGGVVSP